VWVRKIIATFRKNVRYRLGLNAVNPEDHSARTLKTSLLSANPHDVKPQTEYNLHDFTVTKASEPIQSLLGS